MTAQGEETAPSRLVPEGATRIIALYGGVGADLLAAGSSCFVITLKDGGISGSQKFIVGAMGGDLVQSGADSAGTRTGFIFDDREIPGGIDLKVEANKQLTIEMEMAGEDLGDFDGLVTIVFA